MKTRQRSPPAQAGPEGAATGKRVESKELVEELRIHQTELEAQNEELRRVHQELEELYEFAPVGYLILDARSTILKLNSVAATMLGGERVKLLGQHLAAWVSPETQRDFGELLHFARMNGRAMGDVVVAPTGGKPIAVSFIAAADRMEPPNRWRCRAALIDVTEQRAATALRESDRQKSDFIARLSHELRNPLAPIRYSLTVLDRAPPGSEADRRARDVIRRQTDQLARLVDDLLDVSRISRGKIELHLQRLDAREVVRRVCEDARPLFAARRVQLEERGPDEPVWVEADAARLSQIVENLLSNALKFSPAGGEVLVSLGRHAGRCELRIRDQGMGIEAADLERIFHPFVQAERARGSGGMGMGLAVVRELTAMHGGAVHAESTGPGKGAVFVLTLPVAAAPSAEPERTLPPPKARDLSILVIEDNEDSAATLADVLTLRGDHVVTCATGWAGIQAAAEQAPDVVICDIGLPDLTGHDVIRALQRNGGRRAFAIALTGYGQPEDREAALAAGFDAHLVKPPQLERLAEILDEVSRGAPGPPDRPHPAS